MDHSKAEHTWTVAEAKARLSEVLRRSEEEGPQRIGRRKSFVVVPAETWEAHVPPRKPLGQWLIDNMPRGVDIPIPDRRDSGREIPFSDQDEE